jgi:hypothetical protein
MATRTSVAFTLLISALAAAIAGGQEPIREWIPNWAAPAQWEPSLPVSRGPADVGQVTSLGASTSPLPFIGITPCRIADTRGNGFSGQAGPPALSAGMARTFQIAGTVPGVPSQCGIPASAEAVSFNFAVTSLSANGNLVVYPAGEPEPTVSTLNWVPAEVAISNAAVVALGPFTLSITVKVNGPAQNVNLIVDVNGYYAGAVKGGRNTFLGAGAGFSITSGESNTAMGFGALGANTSGGSNTAVGDNALWVNSTACCNTAVGTQALALNTEGTWNTAVGNLALLANVGGDANTAIGFNALKANTEGLSNTAVGWEALRTNVTGSANTAVGTAALANGIGTRNTALGYLAGSTSTSNDNTAVGYNALSSATGGGNIALGSGAGAANTAGGFNMYLGNEGVSSESATIRLGSGMLHSRLFVAGVLGSIVTGAQVLISGTGQLGVAASSARFKEDVRDMGESSARLLNLRPVSFRYKGRAEDPVQFGLIAEEVEKVLPELVLRDASGEIQTVLYNELPVLLLNELQKQQRVIASQSSTIDEQKAAMEALKARLARLEERLLEAPRP